MFFLNLSERLYVGAFIEGELKAIACAYIRLKDSWIVGDVFTSPKYRGIGLGKAVTSEIVRRGIEARADVSTHVRKKCSVMSMYTKLGFVEVREMPWIICFR